MVSVIIPNYNHALYLKQRIDSVLNQTCQDMELILLDDKSTDNSKEIIEQYREHAKVSHIIYNETNSGSTFKQWKKGIQLARGEYIWIAESDDYADKTFIETAMAVLEKDSSIGLVQAQSYNFDENGQVQGLWINRRKSKLWNKDFKETGLQMIKEHMLINNPIVNASAVVFRKPALSEEMIDTSFTLNGDWLLYVKILLHSDFYNIGKPLNYFRQHNNKGSSRNVKNYNNITETARIINFIFSRIHLSKDEKNMVRYVFVSKWADQANNSLFSVLRNRFLTISAEAFKNDRLFLFRLIKKISTKSIQ
ncbi:glycosyltransferase family 2 protein [Viscerimonas tarda]